MSHRMRHLVRGSCNRSMRPRPSLSFRHLAGGCCHSDRRTFFPFHAEGAYRQGLIARVNSKLGEDQPLLGGMAWVVCFADLFRCRWYSPGRRGSLSCLGFCVRSAPEDTSLATSPPCRSEMRREMPHSSSPGRRQRLCGKRADPLSRGCRREAQECPTILHQVTRMRGQREPLRLNSKESFGLTRSNCRGWWRTVDPKKWGAWSESSSPWQQLHSLQCECVMTCALCRFVVCRTNYQRLCALMLAPIALQSFFSRYHHLVGDWPQRVHRGEALHEFTSRISNDGAWVTRPSFFSETAHCFRFNSRFRFNEVIVGRL